MANSLIEIINIKYIDIIVYVHAFFLFLTDQSGFDRISLIHVQ